MSPHTTKIPAVMPTTMPLTRRESFSEISVLASSISSRTRSWARSETSWIACAMLCELFGGICWLVIDPGA